MTCRRFRTRLAACLVPFLAALAGCSTGPFTKPAKVTLYEERQGGSAAPQRQSEPAVSAAPLAPVQPVSREVKTAPVEAPSQASFSGEHTVRSGETVYSIAGLYRIPIRSIIELNGLEAPYALVPGRILKVPVPRDHIVQPGDTLYGISRTYGVAMSALVRLNDIPPPYTIIVGRSLRLPEPVQTAAAAAAPGGETPKEVASPAPAPDPSAPVNEEESTSAPDAASQQAATNPAVPMPPARAEKTFLLPVRGRVISAFGSKGQGLHNDGVNIAAEKGTPVRAAENGIVVYAGNALLGFGNMILVRHADDFMTAYAHNDTLNVQRGDTVRRGQVISTVGSTGNVSTPQLHFEVRKGKSAVNPAKFLPGLARG
jgi:murein DD-endopeptidase MepM/ murein hydrolase activator NlpD